jgi:hypothetical protein
MPDLDTILHSAIERLASVPDDGIGELKFSRFRAPRIVPIGRAWRLGSVLQVERGGGTAGGAVSCGAGWVSGGDTVHFNVEVLEPVLVDGEWRIAWSGAVASLARLEGYLVERTRLLVRDPN